MKLCVECKITLGKVPEKKHSSNYLTLDKYSFSGSESTNLNFAKLIQQNQPYVHNFH
jgi:hypothetical protein